MRPQHDLIPFYRHVLRSGDVALARRLGRILLQDPRYHARASAELRGLPVGAHGGHESEGGRLLDGLLDRVGPLDDG
jgi:hypothetical protein